MIRSVRSSDNRGNCCVGLTGVGPSTAAVAAASVVAVVTVVAAVVVTTVDAFVAPTVVATVATVVIALFLLNEALGVVVHTSVVEAAPLAP